MVHAADDSCIEIPPHGLYVLNFSLCATALLAATASLQTTLEEQRVAQDVPGISAVVVSRDEVVFLGGSGTASLDTGEPITPDTPFYLGSVSKVLTAALTLKLVESDKIQLDDVVTEVNHAPQPPVRVRHLLSHASGLEREGDFGYWFNAEFPSTQKLSRYLAKTQLRFAPGSQTRYSNIGYAALGLIIERTLSRPFKDALQTELLEPLGMKSSGVNRTEGLASGYSPPGRLLPNKQNPFAGVGRQISDRHERMYYGPDAMAPAFGIVSTARDMGQFLRFLLHEESDALLSAATRKKMREPQGSGRGLGLRISSLNGREVAQHGGWFAAHRSHLLLDVEAGIGVVVLTNGDNASPDDIAKALLRSAHQPRSTERKSSP